MFEIDREYLVIPTRDELFVTFETMKGRVQRAVQRGERATNFGDIGHVNANRILNDNPHIGLLLEKFAEGFSHMVEVGDIPVTQAYMAGVKDILEILGVTTTSYQLPDINID